MPEKVKGKVKWFSNRKGFGFVSPASGGDDVFLHHSRIVSDAEYKTLRDGLEVEFEIGTDDKGKPFADKVTSADGSAIPPPDPTRKRNKKKATDVTGGGTVDEGDETKEEATDENTKENKKGRSRNKRRNGANGKKEPKSEWYTELDETVTKSMESRNIMIEAGRAFLSVGDARLKIGTGGYITLAHSSGIVAEGKYTCGKDGKLSISWEKVLKLDGDEWKVSSVDAENGALLNEVDLTDDSVKATGAEESPDTLWGEGKPDPKDTLEKNGFLMRKVALNAAANPPRRGGRGPRSRKKGLKKGGDGTAAPSPAAST
jgi:CspA family cold shock protein